MGKKSAPAIPPPPPLPELKPIQVIAPDIPDMPMPSSVDLPDVNVPDELKAPTSEEIALKAKKEKDAMRNRPGGARGTKFTDTLLADELDEEDINKPLIY